MLRADVGVMERLGLLAGQRENLLHAGGVRDIAGDLGVGPGADLLFNLHAHRVQIETHFLEHIHGDSLPQLDQAEENVFRAHVVVVEAVGLLAGKGEDLLGAGGEIIHRDKVNPTGLEVQFAHGGLGDALEFFAQEIGAEGIALLGAQLFLGGLLKMGGLGGDEEGVELGLQVGGKEGKIGGETQKTQEVEGLLRRDGVGVKDNAVGAADLIGEHAGFFLNQLLAGVVFQVGELANDFDEAIQNLPFRFAEGGLIGDLEQVAEGLGSLAVEPADGEAELVDRFDDLIDLLAQNEAGKMEHGGGTHSGADVGRAGGEVAEGWGEREFEFVLQGGVEFVGGLPSLEEMEARAEGLKADVVLLVDHDGEGFVPVHHQAAPGVFGGMFAADQVFFHEKLLVEGSERFHGNGDLGGTHRGEVGHGGLDRLEKFQAIGFLEPAREGEVFDIAGEPDAAGDDDARIGLRVGGGGGVSVFRFHRSGEYLWNRKLATGCADV